MCGEARISKRITAARLNLSGSREPALEATPAAHTPPPNATSPGTALAAQTNTQHPGAAMAAHMPPEMQAAWLKMAQHVMANTTDVGSDFAAEARRIHEGEAPERAIRGQATRQETLELLEDGIAVMPLPLPQALKGTLQ